MAFDYEDLAKIGGQPQAQSIYSYTTQDNIATVTASGYFNAAIGTLRLNDYIFVNSAGTSQLIEISQSVAPITTLILLDMPTLTQTTGWGSYNDTQYPNSGAAFALVADTDVALPNNAGSNIESQKPSDVTTFYDGAVITGRNGDAIDIMSYFMAVPSAANQWLDIWIDIGGAVGELYRQTFAFPRGSGVERGILYSISSAYTLDTWEANGGTIYIRSNAPCSIYGIVVNVDRSHKAR